MNKYEAQIAEAQISGEKFSEGVGLVRTAIVGAIIIGSLWVIMNGLQGLAGQSGEQLTGMALLVEKFHLSKMIHYCADAVLVTAFVVQRRNAKRAIEQKAKYQQMAENGDSNRSSSGLTPTGNTPND
jgi:hypothetical protein